MLSNIIEKSIIEYRKYLHKIPELGFNEFKTSEFIKNKLLEFGFEIETVAKTGIVAYKEGRLKENIAFRADMDALEVKEQNEIDFKSINEGKMHACGHDGHMAILIGFAQYIHTLDALDYGVVLIFQPAEEGPGGAEIIVKENILSKYNVKAIFGLHILPDINEGKIGVKFGPLMAKTGEFDIDIIGKSGHGAMPHTGIDGIYVASSLINSYQSIVSRNIKPIEGGVVTIGKIVGGERRNIIAESVRLEGTIRAFNEDVYKLIKDRMKKINEGIMDMFGVLINMEVRDMYPAVVNDKKLYDYITSVIDSEKLVELEEMMISEDFSYYQKEIPGFFFMLGSRNEELDFIYPLHNNKFNFNNKILMDGVNTYINIYENIFKYLQGGKDE